MKCANTLIVLIMATIILGCATSQPAARYLVAVNALAGESTNTSKSYVILPGNSDISGADLQFQEYSLILSRALEQRGFRRAIAPDEAEIAVFLAYGVGNPEERTYSYSVPIYGQTGITSSTTRGSISASAYSFGNNLLGSALYSETTDYTRSYGIAGYTNRVWSETVYSRHIFVEAVDLLFHKTNRGILHLWRTGIVSIGPSDDLREVFPVMIGAAMNYFGQSSEKVQRIEIRENDSRVNLVKGIAAERTEK